MPLQDALTRVGNELRNKLLHNGVAPYHADSLPDGYSRLAGRNLSEVIDYVHLTVSDTDPDAPPITITIGIKAGGYLVKMGAVAREEVLEAENSK